MSDSPWVDGPPPDSPLERQYHRVRYLKGSGPLHAVLLGDGLRHCMLHYSATDNRTFPCQGANCICHVTGQNKRYYAYVAAMEPFTHDTFVLQLSEHPAKMILQFIGKYGQLRGMQVELTRARTHRNAMVVAKFSNYAPIITLKPNFDVDSSLLRLWGIHPSQRKDNQRSEDET